MLTLKNVEPAPLLGSLPETPLEALHRQLQECMTAADEAHGKARGPRLRARLDSLRDETISQLEAIREELIDAVEQDEEEEAEDFREYRRQVNADWRASR